MLVPMVASGVNESEKLVAGLGALPQGAQSRNRPVDLPRFA
jgi:hypothetical protein